MGRLLVVHHTPSPALQEMFEAALSGARTDEIEGIEVVPLWNWRIPPMCGLRADLGGRAWAEHHDILGP